MLEFATPLHAHPSERLCGGLAVQMPSIDERPYLIALKTYLRLDFNESVDSSDASELTNFHLECQAALAGNGVDPVTYFQKLQVLVRLANLLQSETPTPHPYCWSWRKQFQHRTPIQFCLFFCNPRRPDTGAKHPILMPCRYLAFILIEYWNIMEYSSLQRHGLRPSHAFQSVESCLG